MLDDDMQRVVREQRLGYVASVCSDGTPNLSPKGTLAVWDDTHLAFAHLHSPGTAANIEAGNQVVEVNVVDPIRRKGYRFKGRATVHREGPTYEAGLRFYRQRSGLEPQRIMAIVLIDVERAAPIVSPAYDDGSTERAIEERSLELYGLGTRSSDLLDPGPPIGLVAPAGVRLFEESPGAFEVAGPFLEGLGVPL